MLLLEAEYLGIVESLLQFGKFEEAEEYCLKILHNDIDINIEIKAQLYVFLSQAYWRMADIPEAEKYSSIAMTYIDKHRDLSAKCKSMIQGNEGAILLQKKCYHESIIYFLEALSYSKDNDDYLSIAKYNINLGVVYNALSDIKKALIFYKEGLKLAKKLQNKSIMANCMVNIGISYVTMSNYPKALTYYELALELQVELGNPYRIADINGNIGVIYSNISNFPKALEYYNKALQIDEELGNRNNLSKHYGNIGVVYSSLSDLQKALEYYRKALSIDEEHNNTFGVIRHLSNIGEIYKDLDEYDKAISYNNQALEILLHNPQLELEATVNGTLGSIYYEMDDFNQALKYFKRTLEIADKIEIKAQIARMTGNIGDVYLRLEQWNNALDHYQKAMMLDKELGIEVGYAGWLGKIGELYSHTEFEHYSIEKAESYLLKALAIQKKYKIKQQQYELHKYLSTLYENHGNINKAYLHFKEFYELENQVHNESAKKQAVELDLIRKIEKIERSNKETIIRFQEKEKILHDILPIEIANRIVSGETTIAEKHENVSIIFIDIVEFTKIVIHLNPEEVVGTLNDLFIDFDSLALELGIEKIKTLGDAYMAACGIPSAKENHAELITEFAFKAIDTAKKHKFPGQQEIKVRVGLHCGSVIAGVIGGHKFTYDLWGDTVNTASRMESHGQREQVHVSDPFLRELCSISIDEEIPETKEFSFGIISIHQRGLIDIKGKGKMHTYFLTLFKE